MMLNATTGGDSRAWEPGCVLNKKWVKEKPSFSKTNQSSSEAWKEFRISNAINTPCHKMIKMQACGYLTLAVCRKVYFFEGLQKPGKSMQKLWLGAQEKASHICISVPFYATLQCGGGAARWNQSRSPSHHSYIKDAIPYCLHSYK